MKNEKLKQRSLKEDTLKKTKQTKNVLLHKQLENDEIFMEIFLMETKLCTTQAPKTKSTDHKMKMSQIVIEKPKKQ